MPPVRVRPVRQNALRAVLQLALELQVRAALFQRGDQRHGLLLEDRNMTGEMAMWGPQCSTDECPLTCFSAAISGTAD